MTYTATLPGGGALPGWLAFDAAACIFSGTPGTGDADHRGDGDRRRHPAESASTAFTLTVQATLPTAEAGAALTDQRGGEVTLAGSGTPHAQGSQTLTYRWRIAGAEHTVLAAGTSWLADANKATATYSVPRRKEVTDRRAVDNGRTVDFELTVTDGDGETDTDTVRMTIRGSTWTEVQASEADASAKESSGRIEFAVTLSAAARNAVSVDYATSNGTARGGRTTPRSRARSPSRRARRARR